MAAAGRGPGRYRPAFRSATSIGGSDRRGQGRQGSDNWPAPSVALGTGLTLGKAIIPRSVLSRGPNPWKSRPRRAPPQALKNTSVRTRRVARTRRYLTSREVEKLMKAARDTGRYGHRDATMILIAYRHGLRACELCDLQWHQVELNTGHLHVRRSKRGTPSVHPMQGDEIRALRRLQREQEASPHVFASERGGPMSAKSFGTLFERLGRRAGMPFTIFPHMLRHACGYALANAGHDTRALLGIVERRGRAWTPTASIR